MPRPLRLEYPGALYHVMARGDGGRRVFESKEDAEAFLALLERACGRCGWRVHAWVLMNNHFHLLLETPEPNLVAGMKWVMGVFSQGWNRRRKRRGHVFQGRYKSVPVNAAENAGEYFRIVADYIHLNPARAGLADGRSGTKLLSYEWSSLRDYARAHAPKWLERSRVLQAFELAQNRRGRLAYVKQLEERAREPGTRPSSASEAALRRGWYLGAESFRDRLLELAAKTIKRVRRESVNGPVPREHDEREAERLAQQALKALGLPDKKSELRKLKAGDERKALVAHLLRERCVVGARWIAQRLGMGHAGGVGRTVKRVMQDSKQRRAYEKLITMFK